MKTPQLQPRTLHVPSEWAKVHRRKLVNALGGKCVKCGSTEDLEINHIDGRDWEPRELSSHARVARYKQEATEGKLNVLCSKCNGGLNPKGKARRRREAGR